MNGVLNEVNATENIAIKVIPYDTEVWMEGTKLIRA